MREVVTQGAALRDAGFPQQPIMPFRRGHVDARVVRTDSPSERSREEHPMSHIIRHTSDLAPVPHVVRGTERSQRSAPGTTPCGRATVRPRLRRASSIAWTGSDEDGFTLVELLVVVLVLATLVGIAVPTFADQRRSAWDAAVRSELRSAMIALESSRAHNGFYSPSALTEADWGFQSSRTVQLRYDLEYRPVGAGGDLSYCLIGWYAPGAELTGTDDSISSGFDGVAALSDVTLWGATSSGVEGPVSATFCAG